MLLDNQWVKEEIIEIENNLRQMTIKKQYIKTCEMQQSSAKKRNLQTSVKVEINEIENRKTEKSMKLGSSKRSRRLSNL